jgi:hypothetical protein
MNCLYCGKEIPVKRRKFCCDNHRIMQYRLNNPEIVKKANKKCNDKKRLLKPLKQMEVKTCLYCKKKFVTDNTNKKYCNTFCSAFNRDVNLATVKKTKIKKIVKIKTSQNYLSLQRLANVYNNRSTNELEFVHKWSPLDTAYYIDGNLKIIKTSTFNDDTIYFKTEEIAKVCCNFFYRTHYNINRSNISYMRNKKGIIENIYDYVK